MAELTDDSSEDEEDNRMTNAPHAPHSPPASMTPDQVREHSQKQLGDSADEPMREGDGQEKRISKAAEKPSEPPNGWHWHAPKVLTSLRFSAPGPALGLCVLPLPCFIGNATMRARTMRFGSTAKVLAECKLEYYIISEWHGTIHLHSDVSAMRLPILRRSASLVLASSRPVLTSGYDSPGIAPRSACPTPEIGKALPGPPQHFLKVL